MENQNDSSLQPKTFTVRSPSIQNERESLAAVDSSEKPDAETRDTQSESNVTDESCDPQEWTVLDVDQHDNNPVSQEHPGNEESLKTAAKKNILIFGAAGSGLSSVSSMLLDGVTVDASTSDFTIKKYRNENNNYNIIEVSGMCEGAKWNVASTNSITNIKAVLESLQTGLDLLICVKKKGRITKSTEDNFNLFVKSICEKKVPVILLITHCENDITNETWITQNIQDFQSYDINPNKLICGCTSQGGSDLHPVIRENMQTQYKETKLQLARAINCYSSNKLRHCSKNTDKAIEEIVNRFQRSSSGDPCNPDALAVEQPSSSFTSLLHNFAAKSIGYAMAKLSYHEPNDELS